MVRRVLVCRWAYVCICRNHSPSVPSGCEIAEIAIRTNAMFTMCVIYVYIMNAVCHCCIVVLWLTLFRVSLDMESSLYLRMRGGCKVAEYL